MRSRLYSSGSHTVWFFQKGDAYIRLAFKKSSDLDSVASLVTRFQIGDGVDWYKNEGGDYSYCIQLDDADGYTLAIYDNFNDSKERFCACIRFSEEDRRFINRSFRAFLRRRNGRTGSSS